MSDYSLTFPVNDGQTMICDILSIHWIVRYLMNEVFFQRVRRDDGETSRGTFLGDELRFNYANEYRRN